MSSDESCGGKGDYDPEDGSGGQAEYWDLPSQQTCGYHSDTERVECSKEAPKESGVQDDTVVKRVLDEAFTQVVCELSTLCEQYIQNVLHTSSDTYVWPHVVHRDLKTLEQHLRKILEGRPKKQRTQQDCGDLLKQMELFETGAKKRIKDIENEMMQIRLDIIAKQKCFDTNQAYDAMDTKGGDKVDDAQCHKQKRCEEVLKALKRPTVYAEAILQWLSCTIVCVFGDE